MYGQSHPFTVSNAPGPGVTDMEFVIRVHTGLTRTLANLILAAGTPFVTLPVAVEGSYGSRPRSDEYEHVLLVAGGSGITYLSSVLSEIVRRSRDYSATKDVTLVWAIHHLNQAQWIGALLKEARDFADATGLRLNIDLYVTRDDTYSRTPSLGDESSVNSSEATTPTEEKKFDLSQPAIGSQDLGRANLHYTRPDVTAIVQEFVAQREGRSMVLACGPEQIGNAVTVAGTSVAKSDDLVYVASFEG